VRELPPEMFPQSIQALLRARLERLTRDEQLEMELGAVIGRVFWRSAVAELAQEAVGAAAGSHLLALVQRDLLSPAMSDFVGDDAYSFRHILVRDTAYAALPKTTRAEAHERFSIWLERAAGARAREYDEILGYHLERAFVLRAELGLVGETQRSLARRAAARLSAAGVRSFARGDMPAAVSLLGRAHELLRADYPERLRLVPRLAEALRWCGDLRRAEVVLDRALDEARAQNDERLTIRMKLARAAVLDQTAGQEQVGHAAVKMFRAAGDDEGLARAWMLIAQTCAAEGRIADAEAAWTRALPAAQRAVPEMVEETALALAWWGAYGPNPMSDVASRLDALEAQVAGRPYLEGTLLRGRAFVAATRAEFATAHRLLQRARETFVSLGLPHVAAVVSHSDYEVALREGRLGALVDSLRADEIALDEADEQWTRSTTLAMLAHSQYEAGQLAAAEQTATRARDLTGPGDTLNEVLWRTAAAKVLARGGEHAQAQQLASEAVAVISPTDWLCFKADALLDQASVLILGGRRGEAQHAVDQAVRLYVQKGDTASEHRARNLRAGRL
jgi:tetratricopeptide (TPR) repeat protein